MSENINIPKKHLIIGKTSLSKDFFVPVQNQPLFVKPIGGLWASPYHPRSKYKSAWHEWCACEQCEWLSNDSVVIDINHNCRTYIIDTLEDLINLFEIVGEAKNRLTHFFAFSPKYLNFEKASTLYDVIYLTMKGQWRTRMPLKNMQYNLYGWDCESTLILNYDCIESWKYKKLNIVKENNDEQD